MRALEVFEAISAPDLFSRPRTGQYFSKTDRVGRPAGAVPFTRAQKLSHRTCLRGQSLVVARCTFARFQTPLSDSEQIAGAILTGLSKHVPGGEPIFLDVPEVNPAAVRLVERCGMTREEGLAHPLQQ